jgi:hypothetical protein
MFSSRTEGWVLLVVALVAAGFNLFKAVHVDDAGHLENALWILKDPLHPMSGLVNWEGYALPISHQNQPHLFFYGLAAVIACVGPSEWVLHAAMALITWTVLGLFLYLARRVIPSQAVLATVLFGLGPAFLPGQNLMLDVPLVGLWIAVGLCLIPPAGQPPRYGAAAVLVSLACLTKYTSLVLIPVLAFVLWHRRSWRWAWVLGVPVAALAAWSAWNLMDYGGIHLLGRDVKPFTLANLSAGWVDWVCGLGAVMPLAWGYARGAVFGRWRGVVPGACVLGGIAVFATALSMQPGRPGHAVLWGCFYAFGLVVLCAVCARVLAEAREGSQWNLARVGEPTWILVLWMAGSACFNIWFAPFMAVRHLLLAVPPVLLLTLPGLEGLGRSRWWLAVGLTVGLGAGLAASDFVLAGVYRNVALEVLGRPGVRDAQTVWFDGHWGWQWYARKAGLRQYDSLATRFAAGDVIVSPSVPDRQFDPEAHPRARMERVDEWDIPSGWVSLLRTMGRNPGGGYYAFGLGVLAPPWFFSNDAVEHFVVYRATASEEHSRP